jgi:hypothetical protein
MATQLTMPSVMKTKKITRMISQGRFLGGWEVA